MKRFLIFLGFFFTSLALYAQSTTGNTYALVIGIAAYENPNIKGLEFANKDAKLFAEWLQSENGRRIPADNMRLLLNEQATLAAIYNGLDWLKENCQANDEVFVYFSGHGDVESNEQKNRGYLLAYNTPPNNYPNHAISIEQLNRDANYLSLEKKAKVCLITDACRSGKLAGDFFKGKQWAAQQLQTVLHNEIRLAACAVDQEAAEAQFWGGGRGVFSYYLLKGLNGQADKNRDAKISFEELQGYIKEAFQQDEYLKIIQHKQTPVTDGNPLVVLANTSSGGQGTAAQSMVKDTVVQSPLDYFFEFAVNEPIESFIAFDSLDHLTEKNLALYVVDQCLQKDSANRAREDVSGKFHVDGSFHREKLTALYNALGQSKGMYKAFLSRWVELVQTKAQAMINAYLNGEEAELEKRQYYYSGARQYNGFLPMLKKALDLVPPQHHLAGVLQVNIDYLSGVLTRLDLAFSNKKDSLVKRAFQYQFKTLAAEPYAAYVHNELANLYVHQKKFDTAQYHFNLATGLAKTWAIPWSNQIRMNLMTKDFVKANRALQIADSLQPNLSYVYMNGGLLMEKQNKTLEAITFYLKAIKINPVHFLPYERLGHLYLQTGAFQSSNQCFMQARHLRQSFALNSDYFSFGAELGGDNGPEQEQNLDTCLTPATLQNLQQTPLWWLLKGLSAPQDSPTDSLVGMFQQALQRQPNLPLAHHYMAKLYLAKQNHAAAIPLLKEAIQLHAADSLLYPSIPALGTSEQTTACIAQFLRTKAYGKREDFYLLAHALVAEKKLPEALACYAQVNAIENQILLDQATYKDFEKNRSQARSILQEEQEGPVIPLPAFKNKPQPIIDTLTKYDDMFVFPELYDKFENPVQMASVVLRVRLLEQMGEFEQAESVLLHQVIQSRQAGDLRDKVLSARPMRTAGFVTHINFFWVKTNRELEIVVHDFYDRMIKNQPRNHHWKQNAAAFIHGRLKLAYDQLPQTLYASFSNDLTEHAYPWQLDDAGYDTQNLAWPVPGLADTIFIALPAFDPVETALADAEEAQALSPLATADFQQAVVLGDLNNWVDADQDAQKWYGLALQHNAKDSSTRKKMVNMLLHAGDHVAAYRHLDTLYRLGQLNPKDQNQLV
ncbi:MAG: hypothetical protein EAZ80_10760, partial [Runella slithyformis]